MIEDKFFFVFLSLDQLLSQAGHSHRYWYVHACNTYYESGNRTEDLGFSDNNLSHKSTEQIQLPWLLWIDKRKITVLFFLNGESSCSTDIFRTNAQWGNSSDEKALAPRPMVFNYSRTTLLKTIQGWNDKAPQQFNTIEDRSSNYNRLSKDFLRRNVRLIHAASKPLL